MRHIDTESLSLLCKSLHERRYTILDDPDGTGWKICLCVTFSYVVLNSLLIAKLTIAYQDWGSQEGLFIGRKEEAQYGIADTKSIPKDRVAKENGSVYIIVVVVALTATIGGAHMLNVVLEFL